MALVRTDPFRDFDRMVNHFFGPATRSLGMPMDAFRRNDRFLLQLDLPGVAPDSIELTVDDNMLTVRATRPEPTMSEGIEPLITERPYGTFTRQILLGDNLDTERIDADYAAGVLTVSIPVAEHAKPRRIQVADREQRQPVTGQPAEQRGAVTA